MIALSERGISRHLFGPGPANSDPRVAGAASLPLIGHMDPGFSVIMDEICDGLREVFGTANPCTFPVSGTGTAGMEFLAVNLVEPGDRVVVGVNGVFGGRIAEMVTKLGGHVIRVQAPWGQPIGPDAIRQAVANAGSIDIVWLVHAETSTGVQQPDLDKIADIARANGALMLVDTVTSFLGLPIDVDRTGIDSAFSGSQKCLGVTPGLAPATIGPRAVERFRRRRSPVPSWYLDLDKLLAYWESTDSRRSYHHTAPIGPLFSLHEALRISQEVGLDAVRQRLRRAADVLANGLTELGFQYVVTDERHRLPMLHCVRPPAGCDESRLRQLLLERHQVEVGGGLGDLAGQAVRIGLMGANAMPERAEFVVDSIADTIANM